MSLLIGCPTHQYALSAKFVHLGDARVVKVVKNLYLVMQEAPSALLRLQVLWIENFDGPVLLSIKLTSQIDM